MEIKKRRIFSIIILIFITLLATFGVSNAIFRYLVTPSYKINYVFWFALTRYTNISNILGLIASLISSIYLIRNKEYPFWLKILRFIAASFLLFTFVIVYVILAPISKDWKLVYDPSYLLYTHTIIPLATLFEYLYLDNKNKLLSYKLTFVSTGLTLTYGITIIIALLIIGNDNGAPYPFFEIHRLPPYQTVLFMLGLVAISVILNLLFIYLSNLITKKRKIPS